MVKQVEEAQGDRASQGIPIPHVIQLLTRFTKDSGDPVPTRSKAEATAQEAIRCGLLSAYPSDSEGPATRVVTTEVYHDLMLYISGSHSFNDMLNTAREDRRFNGLFKKASADLGNGLTYDAQREMGRTPCCQMGI
jgi:hypothetical protein